MPLVRIRSRVAELLGEPEQLPIRLHGGLSDLEFDLAKAALLCVDMQEHVATPRAGPKAQAARLLGLEAELEYYWLQLEGAIRNLERLQAAFRASDRQVVHTRGGLLTSDGRDRGRMKSLLRAGRRVRAGPESTESTPVLTGDSPIIPALAPRENELVFLKNGATAFNVTRMDLALRSLGVEVLVIGGVVTHQCVEATARAAFDLDFGVVLVDDACATYSDELRRATLRSLGDWFCKVVSTEDVLAWFRQSS